MHRFLAALLLLITMSGYGAVLYLDKNQLVDPVSFSGYSIEELILSRNSVFARYGYIFKSSALNRHFLPMGWYKPNRNFSYTMLTTIDRQNVNAILSVEKKKVDDLKNSVTGTKCRTTRYFMAVRDTERIPASVEGEIRKWWQKKAGNALYAQIHVPVLLAAGLSVEKDAAFIGARLKNCQEPFVYWEAGYDDLGRLRVLKNCYCEYGWPNGCTDTYYFDENEKLVLMQGGVRGTTVNYRYYYQYCLGSVVWVEVTIINGSAGIPDEMEKFFY
jgi:hypothetical protein